MDRSNILISCFWNLHCSRSPLWILTIIAHVDIESLGDGSALVLNLDCGILECRAGHVSKWLVPRSRISNWDPNKWLRRKWAYSGGQSTCLRGHCKRGLHFRWSSCEMKWEDFSIVNMTSWDPGQGREFRTSGRKAGIAKRFVHG